MQRFFGKFFLIALSGLLFISRGSAYASDSNSYTPELLRYTFVDGDADKFRAHHWFKDTYDGGIREYLIEDYKGMGYGTTLSMEGAAMPGDRNFNALWTLKKEDLGYVKLDYQQFRKYYDPVGGVYHRFGNLSVNWVDKDLHLDIGHLAFEAGLTLENLPEMIFFYEHEFKEGTKSRLTWTAVKEGTTTRNIGPSWQDVDEKVDTIGIRTNYEIGGYTIHGEQKWELFHANTLREERSLSTTSSTADPAARKIRDQWQTPEADLMTTTWQIERWSKDEKAFFSAGYRFAHMNNSELENIREFNEFRVPTNFTAPKSAVDATSNSKYDNHTWVASFLSMPKSWMTVVTKLKSEVFQRHGASTYPHDTTPVAALGATPDGIIDTTDISRTEDNFSRFGEAVSLRFTKIPRTALYTDLEFEQARNALEEDRASLGGQSVGDASENLTRETITYIQRGALSFGGRVVPCPYADLTTQFKHRWNRNDYDNIRHADPAAGAKSAFEDEQNILTDEFSSRLTLRPCRWLQPSIRYQLRNDKYFSRIIGQPLGTWSEMASRTYTFDLAFEPRPDLLLMTSYMLQNAWTQTPARYFIPTIPTFNADVQTLLLSADYSLNSKMTLTSTVEYSKANNFNDYSNVGLPLGSDFREVDVTVGFKWLIRKDLTIEPKYGFYHYKPNELTEFGGYDAHVIWLDFKYDWA